MKIKILRRQSICMTCFPLASQSFRTKTRYASRTTHTHTQQWEKIYFTIDFDKNKSNLNPIEKFFHLFQLKMNLMKYSTRTNISE